MSGLCLGKALKAKYQLERLNQLIFDNCSAICGLSSLNMMYCMMYYMYINMMDSKIGEMKMCQNDTIHSKRTLVSECN